MTEEDIKIAQEKRNLASQAVGRICGVLADEMDVLAKDDVPEAEFLSQLATAILGGVACFFQETNIPKLRYNEFVQLSAEKAWGFQEELKRS